MDLLNTAQDSHHEGGASLLDGRSYGNVDGIELPSVGIASGLVVEEETGTQSSSILAAGKSRNRLMAIGGSIMAAVVLLGGLSALSSAGNGDVSSLPVYMSQSVNPALNVARKPVFVKPNATNNNPAPQQSFLPFYTLDHVLKNPFSPQAKALKWVEGYPHFRAIRRWRKRQLMALATFFYSTGGSLHWQDDAKRDWLSTKSHECNWQGDVLFKPECSKKKLKGRYTRLEIGMNNLQGTLPPELSLLSAMVYLELYGNDKLVGSVPSEFGKMTSLRDISLYRNKLNGPLPSQMGRLTRLSVLNLDNNQFTGTLPSELGLLTSMTRLHLSDNQFSGTIPSVLKQLSNLQSLFLHGNSLNGTVSPSMCYFADLEEIWVDCDTVKCPCSQCKCGETSVAEPDQPAEHEEGADTSNMDFSSSEDPALAASP